MKSIIPMVSGLLAVSISAEFHNGIYYDQWHTANLPGKNVTEGINHVYIAFVDPRVLNTDPPGNYTPFTTVSAVKERFGEKTKVLISIGGWGAFFNESAQNASSRSLFAKNIGIMINETGCDGVDIDWEYPAGNGIDYKIIPNDKKTSEIETYPILLEAVRAEIGTEKLLSIAVPGRKEDMIAYTSETVPRIAAVVDYVNLMTYDLMNRRDNVTLHHTGVQGSLETVDAYLSMGLPASKAILGFAFYSKYFTTNASSNCAKNPLGCATVAMEDALGNDNGKSGAITFERVNMVPTIAPTNLTVSPDSSCGPAAGYKCPASLCCSQYGYCGSTEAHCGTGCTEGYGNCTGPSIAKSWQDALANGTAGTVGGGQYYWDSSINLFWTWDTPQFIAAKFEKIVKARGLGGVFAWSLGEDTFDYSHMLAIQKGVKEMNNCTTSL